MENASKALIIAGAILLSILIIAIGMFIYNSAQSTINESITSFSTQEIDAFNNNFESYRGQATGSNVSSMLSRLIANAKTYADEPTKIPAVKFDQVVAGEAKEQDVKPGVAGDEKGQQAYIESLTAIKNKIENKHMYTVTMSYQANGLIDYIAVGYSAEIKDSEKLHADRNKK